MRRSTSGKALKRLAYFMLTFIMLISMSTIAYCGSGTITFINNDAEGFVDFIASDGEGGSDGIGNIEIQVYGINNNGEILAGGGAGLEYHDAMDTGWDGVPAIVTYVDSIAGESTYGMAIKAVGNSNFRLQSFNFYDWGSWDGGQWTVEAFDEGKPKELNGLKVSTVFNGNSDGNYVYVNCSAVDGFDSVDEVRIHRSDGTGSWFGINDIAIADSPPSAITGAASGLSTTGATLNGTVNDNGIDTEVTFEYGTTTGYGTSVAAGTDGILSAGTGSTTMSKAISGLAPNTTYHYRVKGINGAGTTNGADQTFTTLTAAPTVTTDAASGVGTTTATFNGTVNANNGSTIVTFEYGTTTGYGTAVTAAQSPATGIGNTTVSKAVSGLVPNTTYHYRAVGVNGGGMTTGLDQTFTTAQAPPEATTNAASGVTTTGATLNGTVNANNLSSTVTFEYGTDTNYGTTVTAAQSPVTGTSNTTVSKAITGLVSNTTYHYRVIGVNGAGMTNGADQTFTTLTAAPTVTTDAASGVGTTTATFNGTVNANNGSTTVTFEYGTTTGYGTAVTAAQSPATGTGNTTVSKAVSGLVPNTTYHYRAVGVNGGGTTTGLDQTFTTAQAPPEATTNAASGVTTTGATLNGTVNANNLSSTVTFEYGTDTNYGTTVTAAQSPVTGTSNTTVSKAITGLVSNTTYHYRVIGVNGAGTTNGADQTFTTLTAAPTVTTDAASGVGTTTATFNGTVNANNGSTTVTFEYGTTTGYGTAVTAAQSPATGIGNTTVSKAVSGLVPNTTYHYRAVGVNGGGTTTGLDQTFTTAQAPPEVTTNAASGVTTTGATLNGTVNANNGSTTVTFEYGTTVAYGTMVTATQSPATGYGNTTVSKAISGLVPNTTYHYRVIGANGAGTTNGADQTFTTLTAAPTVTTDAASGVGTTTATFNGTVNANNGSTTVTFEYGTTTGYGTAVTAAQSPATGTGNTTVSKAVSGLVPNTTYHYRAVGVNGGGTTNGVDRTFTTAQAPPEATTNAASGVTTTGATLNGTVNANNGSTTVTFEYGTTVAYGTMVTATQSPATGYGNTTVSKAISGLVPNTTYHYRVIGANGAGTTNGADQTFLTLTKAAKILTADTTGNDVDHNIEVTFEADASFEGAIIGVSFNGHALTVNTDYVVNSGNVTLKPSGGNINLRTPATGNVVITATGYNNSIVGQTLNVGAAASMEVTQNITAPASNGGQFAQQPIITLKDQYGNICTNNSSTIITVSKKDSGTWTLTGTLTATVSSGVATFSGLGANNTAAVAGAQLAFDTAGLTQAVSTAVNLPVPASSGNSDRESSSSTNTTTTTNTVQQPITPITEILVNGKVQNAGTTTSSIFDNKTVTTITVDNKKIEEKLKTEGKNTTIVIPSNNNSDVVVGVLNGQIIKSMETKEAILEIRTGNVTYTLPASEVNIDQVSSQIGEKVELKDIKVSVSIAEASKDTMKIVEDTANKNRYQVVVKPVDFEITCTSGNKTVNVSKFNGYVERMVAIPEGIDPSRITTGIVLNNDGTFSHVPTSIITISGKYYAKINSLTNSTYSVIWSPKTFKDVENHWSKNDVNDMGSRLVIEGDKDGYFDPDREITRGEFATIVIKGLGLMRTDTGEDVYKDVKKADWYYDAVHIANEYGLISGTGNYKYEPSRKITREEAMIIIARAMSLVKMNITISEAEMEDLLNMYKDSSKISNWAKKSAAACIKNGIVTGSNENINAEENITRAEAAALIRRLLQKAKLI